MVRFEAAIVPEDIEGGGCDGALAHRLRHQVEVVALGTSELRVADRPRRRVDQLNRGQ